MTAINILQPLGQSTSLIYDQLVVIGVFSFLALAVYWCVMMYLIYLLQENLSHELAGLEHLGAGQTIVDMQSLAARLDDALLAHYRQVLRDAGLAGPYGAGDVGDCQFAKAEGIDDLQAGCAAQGLADVGV